MMNGFEMMDGLKMMKATLSLSALSDITFGINTRDISELYH